MEKKSLYDRDLKIREENKLKYQEQLNNNERKQSTSPHKNRRRPIIKPSENKSGVTSIDELEDIQSDQDDNNTSDRYRTRKPVGRIRSDEGNYEEDNELFQELPVNTRKVIKEDAQNATNSKTQKSIDIMSKAKELAKGRDESTILHPPGHPLSVSN